MSKCNTCKSTIKENCDFNQGRCPHRKPMIDIQSKDTSKGHFYVSMVKSALRVVAGVMFIQGSMILGGAFLIAAEALGIVEELV